MAKYKNKVCISAAYSPDTDKFTWKSQISQWFWKSQHAALLHTVTTIQLPIFSKLPKNLLSI